MVGLFFYPKAFNPLQLRLQHFLDYAGYPMLYMRLILLIQQRDPSRSVVSSVIQKTANFGGLGLEWIRDLIL